jgi:hypothetical protein
MGRFDEPNMGLPIIGSVLRELLLLGYNITDALKEKNGTPKE